MDGNKLYAVYFLLLAIATICISFLDPTNYLGFGNAIIAPAAYIFLVGTIYILALIFMIPAIFFLYLIGITSGFTLPDILVSSWLTWLGRLMLVFLIPLSISVFIVFILDLPDKNVVIPILLLNAAIGLILPQPLKMQKTFEWVPLRKRVERHSNDNDVVKGNQSIFDLLPPETGFDKVPIIMVFLFIFIIVVLQWLPVFEMVQQRLYFVSMLYLATAGIYYVRSK